MDEAFGIGIDELKNADAILSKNVYFWIAYQHVDDAPIEEKLAGNLRSCYISKKISSVADNTDIVWWKKNLYQLIKDM